MPLQALAISEIRHRPPEKDDSPGAEHEVESTNGLTASDILRSVTEIILMAHSTC